MDNKFYKLGGTRGADRGIIHSEKWEKHKNSTHAKSNSTKFSLIFFFYNGY